MTSVDTNRITTLAAHLLIQAGMPLQDVSTALNLTADTVRALTADTAAAPAPGCPTWCVTGPHEAYPADPHDDGVRLHTSGAAGATGACGTEVSVESQWESGDPDAPDAIVYINVSEESPRTPVGRMTAAELELAPAKARELGLALLAAADKADSVAVAVAR